MDIKIKTKTTIKKENIMNIQKMNSPYRQAKKEMLPLHSQWMNALEKEVELSRLDMTENEIVEEFKNCLSHDYDYDDIKEQFEFLIENHTEGY